MNDKHLLIISRMHAQLHLYITTSDIILSPLINLNTLSHFVILICRVYSETLHGLLAETTADYV